MSLIPLKMKQGPRDADLPKDTVTVTNPNQAGIPTLLPGALLLLPGGSSPLSLLQCVYLRGLPPPGCMLPNLKEN